MGHLVQIQTNLVFFLLNTLKPTTNAKKILGAFFGVGQIFKAQNGECVEIIAETILQVLKKMYFRRIWSELNNLFVIFWDTHFLFEIIKGHDRFFMINLYNKGPILTKYISIGTTSYLYSYDELIRYFHEVRNYESTFFFCETEFVYLSLCFGNTIHYSWNHLMGRAIDLFLSFIPRLFNGWTWPQILL